MPEESPFRCLGGSRVSPAAPGSACEGRPEEIERERKRKKWRLGSKKKTEDGDAFRGRRESSRSSCAKGDGVIVITRQKLFSGKF